MYEELMKKLANGKSFRREEIEEFFAEVKKKHLSVVKQAAILVALNIKGISSKELSSFVRVLRSEMPKVLRIPSAIDICGTGGSDLARINTSTISAFILSALGVPVAKHGNKAVTGPFGSFDLLETLGINIDLDTNKIEKMIRRRQLGFLYARAFHPVMRHFARVRKELGIPTVFNLLGPLLNPAGTQRQIIGTTFRSQMNTIAEAARTLGIKSLLVVSGEDGLDEVTLTGKTFVTELKYGKIRNFILKPSSFGIKACAFEDIKGGNKRFNTKIAIDILRGTCQTAHRDLVLVNTALALKLVGPYSNLKKAYAVAKECLESGKAYSKFLEYKQASNAPNILLEITERKRREVAMRKKRYPLHKIKNHIKISHRSFRDALLRNGLSLIAEIKKASPCEGKISKSRLDIARLARRYELAGARAISVVTDKHYFQGTLKFLDTVKISTYHTPLLCKDFIIDEYQIYEARKHGADAILLIASILSAEEIQRMLNTARSLNMDAVCEVHNEDDLKQALQTDAKIIGINNRNLHNFRVDLKTTERLIRKIPSDHIIISESGIRTRLQIKRLEKRVDAILVGTTLMKSKAPSEKIIQLIGKRKPLLKICGIQSVREALLCERLGVELIGLNFVPSSARRISYQSAAQIIRSLRKKKKLGIKIIGVFRDHEISKINKAADRLNLDAVQLSGKESLAETKKLIKPVFKGISIRNKSDLKLAQRFTNKNVSVILDGINPGAGKTFDHHLLEGFHQPYFLAGGINMDNVRQIMTDHQPFGLDIASGVETNGKRDYEKIRCLVKLVKQSSQ